MHFWVQEVSPECVKIEVNNKPWILLLCRSEGIVSSASVASLYQLDLGFGGECVNSVHC